VFYDCVVLSPPQLMSLFGHSLLTFCWWSFFPPPNFSLGRMLFLLDVVEVFFEGAPLFLDEL